MKKVTRVKRILSLILCMAMLLGNVAFAATSDPVLTPANDQQVDNYGGDTVISEDKVTLSKVVEGDGSENYFNIDLTVTTETNIKDIISNPDIAVVIVMDGSNTMKTYNIDGSKHADGDGKTTRVNAAIAAAQNFIEQFQKASADTVANRKVGFVVFDSDAHLGFDLTECKSATQAGTIKNNIKGKAHEFVDVLESTRSSRRFTNIEGGLKMAKNMLAAETSIQNQYKFIIFLSDGFPTTYCMSSTGANQYTGYDVYMDSNNKFLKNKGYGTDKASLKALAQAGTDGIFYNLKKDVACTDGDNYSDKGAQRAESMAKSIKKSGINIYSLGVGFYSNSVDSVGGDTGYLIDGPASGKYVIGNNTDSFTAWLTGTATTGIGSNFYKSAMSTKDLKDAFTDVFKEIKTKSETAASASWLAGDPIPEDFEFLGFYGIDGSENNKSLKGSNGESKENTASFSNSRISWDLKKSGYTTTSVTNGRTTTTVYTYHLKYALRLKNETKDFKTEELATNGTTTLEYIVREDENGTNVVSQIKTAEFKIPAVEGYLGNLSFKKVDQFGKGLAGAVFTLTHTDGCGVNVKTMTATSGADGTVSFTGIPSGHTYQLKETSFPGGTLEFAATYGVSVAYGEVSVTAPRGAARWSGKVTNYVVQPTEVTGTDTITVTKEWNDFNDKYELRAPSVTVELIKDGIPTGDTKVLSASNDWTATWTELDEGHAYTVEETSAVDKYLPFSLGKEENIFTVTNTLDYENVSKAAISVTKTWADGNEKHAGEEIYVVLTQNGRAYETATLSAINGWTWSWDDLNVNYAYDVNEISVAHYDTEKKVTEGADAYAFNYEFINTPIPKYEIEVNYFIDGTDIKLDDSVYDGPYERGYKYDENDKFVEQFEKDGVTYVYVRADGDAISGTLDENKVINLYYKPLHDVTVNYYIFGTDTKLIDSYETKPELEGTDYDVQDQRIGYITKGEDTYILVDEKGDPYTGTLDSDKVLDLYYMLMVDEPEEEPEDTITPPDEPEDEVEEEVLSETTEIPEEPEDEPVLIEEEEVPLADAPEVPEEELEEMPEDPVPLADVPATGESWGWAFAAFALALMAAVLTFFRNKETE